MLSIQKVVDGKAHVASHTFYLNLPGSMSDVNTLKDEGNKAFSAKEYDKAMDLFSQAIQLDPTNHVLYSNRSAAKAGKKLWDAALEDAEEVRIRCMLRSSNCGLTYTPLTLRVLLVHTSKPAVVKGLRTQGRSSAWCPSF